MHTTIANEDLDNVKGGAATTRDSAAARCSGLGGLGDPSTMLMMSLQSSLASLANNNNNNGGLNATTMLCLVLAMSGGRQDHGVSGGFNRFGGYYYRYW
jgi:hypothetical protein